MKDKYFVNEAIEEAICDYIKNGKNTGLKDTFSILIIRLLTIIYGRLDIINPYYLKDNVVLMNNLTKYGMSNTDVALFFEEFMSYKNKEQEIKGKDIINPYKIRILKIIIDMFIYKKNNGEVTFEEEEDFLKLACVDKDLEKYYYSKLNNDDDTLEIKAPVKTSDNINLEALSYLGINLSNIENMSSKEITEANNDAYKYFNIDIDSANREEELEQKLAKLKNKELETATSAGYVNILLLMSVIVTTISIMIIVFLNV